MLPAPQVRNQQDRQAYEAAWRESLAQEPSAFRRQHGVGIRVRQRLLGFITLPHQLHTHRTPRWRILHRLSLSNLHCTQCLHCPTAFARDAAPAGGWIRRAAQRETQERPRRWAWR